MAGKVGQEARVATLIGSPRLLVIVALFIASLLTANIIAVKLIDVGGIVLPAGIIVFPLSYIVGDVLTEVYGYRTARLVIWLGFLANLVMVVFIWLGGLLPAAGFWQNQAAYDQILGFTARLLGASFVAYLIGEFTNSYVLARLKVATQGRFLWLRTISSTIVGQGIDSLVFTSLAFMGQVPGDTLVQLISRQWGAKVLYEAVATPFTYMVVGYLKRAEGLDAYDRSINFNPLAVGR